MRGRIRKVRNTDDRVKLIVQRIERGKLSRIVHTFASMAVTDFSGTGWAIKPRDWPAEVCAIADFLQANIRYTLDTYNVDTYSTADRIIQMAKGDCDDFVIVGGAMLQAVGYPCKVKVIRLQGQAEFHHIYLLVGLPPDNPRSWMPFDPTQPGICDKEPMGIAQEKVYNM